MFKPTKKEEQEIKDVVSNLLKKIKIKDAKAVLGGSGAKGTWLAGTHDVDIFVKFNYKKYKNKSDKLSDILAKGLKKFKLIRLHGSRDYFQIKQGKFTFEIVPILNIKKASEAKNITDISPLHANWVNKYEFKEDIRMVKQFCRAQKIYGAESYIRGFSGYALEVLTIYYKGFKNLIRKVAKWKDKIIIDVKKQLKDPLEELNVSKVQTPIILVDPVDKTRNVCAVVSKEKFEKLKKVCKDYLKNPSNKFFVVKEEKVPKGSIILKVDVLKGKKDIIGAKLFKAFGFIEKNLIREGFRLKAGWIWNKEVLFWFNVKNKKLDKYRIQRGPPVSLKEHVAKFKKRNKNVFKKGGKYFAKVERDFVKIEDVLKNLIKRDEVKKRVKSIRFK